MPRKKDRSNRGNTYGVGVDRVELRCASSGSSRAPFSSERDRNPLSPVKVLLSIAGSDPSGCSGIAADIKVAQALGFHLSFAITSITVQNSAAVLMATPVTGQQLLGQLKAISAQFPLAAVKIGMVASAEIAEVIADWLGTQPRMPVVYDPVLRASSGGWLYDSTSCEILSKKLLPCCDLITPNFFEAAFLLETPIDQVRENTAQAGRALLQLMKGSTDEENSGRAVLITGGDEEGALVRDYLFYDGMFAEVTGQKVFTENTRGTGCALSTAIACHLVSTSDVLLAVTQSRRYVEETLMNSRINNISTIGAGPLLHQKIVN
ncbi:MAG: hydroxymethylpyrimidine/phosphomethylpyrimidine kinase [bacterium]|nr:hydroxymethylpyrimidine/phosphomethylpyrimidine kinase [bacterium]